MSDDLRDLQRMRRFEQLRSAVRTEADRYTRAWRVVRNLEVLRGHMSWSFGNQLELNTLFFLPFRGRKQEFEAITLNFRRMGETFLMTTLAALDPRNAPHDSRLDVLPWLPSWSLIFQPGVHLEMIATGCTDERVREIMGDNLCYRGVELLP